MPNTKAKAEPKKATTNDSLAGVLKDFKSSWDYTSGSWHKRWQDNYKLYNNQRVNIGYVGISNVFVPITSSTVDTLTSGLYGSKPKIEYIPPHDSEDPTDSDPTTDVLNSLVDYYWDKDQWDLKVPETGKFKFMLGTAVDYFCWEGDHPVLIHVPIRDFFIDPLATSIENARYMGRRYLTTVDELKSYEVVDPDTGNMVPKYTNLDNVNDYKSPEFTDKEQKDMWYGSTLEEPEEGQVECVEYWTEDKVVTVANRCVVIEDAENYYKAKGRQNGDQYAKGIMPFADDRDVVDPSLFYAKSTVDGIAGQQEQLNDLTNQLSDSITYVLNQQYIIDKKYAHLQGQVRNLPGATYVAEANAITPIQRGTIPPDAFMQIQNIKNEIRENTGINEIVKGAPQDGSKATATEINAQVAGAGQRLNLKVSQLENGYFHRVARILFAMIRLYVTKPILVRVIGEDGVEYQSFDPKTLKNGTYEPRIQLDITVENKKQGQASQAKEMYAAFMNDPDINQPALKKLVLQRGFDLDADEVSNLLQPPLPAGMPGLPPGMPQPGMGAPALPPGAAAPQGAPMPMPMPPQAAPAPPVGPPVQTPQGPIQLDAMHALVASLPPEILDRLPKDTSEQELQMIAQAYLAEQQQQGAPA